MKYRAASTQIKEIPIVFRGSVNKSDKQIESIEIINSTITVEETIGNVHQYSFELPYYDGKPAINAGQHCNISIYGEDPYNNVVARNADYYGDTFIEIGAPYMSNNDTFDDTLYKVSISCFDQPESLTQYVTISWVLESTTIYISVVTNYITYIPVTKVFAAEITGNGQVKRFHCRFALGENGTLHIKPYVILNGNIRVDLCAFASNGDNYISGDNEEIAFDCYVPVETHAVAYVEAENVGEYESILDAAMVVQYEDFVEPESIVGYEGINLNRR